MGYKVKWYQFVSQLNDLFQDPEVHDNQQITDDIQLWYAEIPVFHCVTNL